jgi:glutamate--cysteine ligase
MPKLTIEDTKQWTDEKIFRLQPASYYAEHPYWPGAVGLEIEMLPVRVKKNDPSGTLHKPASVPLQEGEDSLANALISIASDHAWKVEYSKDISGKTILLGIKLEDADNISFEPGGQLEFSSRPYGCLSEAVIRTRKVQSILDNGLKSISDIDIMQIGMNPWHSVEELGLQMQKPRYVAMNKYFSSISPYGPMMMRQTCTVQVNLDFGRTEHMMASRYLASMLLAPFVGAMFANSGVQSTRPNGYKSMRLKVWRHMDPSRTGVPPLDRIKRSLNKASCVDTYFEFLRAARVVFATPLGYKVTSKAVTWEEWVESGIEGVYPETTDLETHLSLLFPDVRARGFLELRSVDCQLRRWQFVPAAWWLGLLYDEKACDQVIDRLLAYEGQMDDLLDQAPYGLQDKRLLEGAKMLTELALEGLGRLPGCYSGEGVAESLIHFAEAYTMRGRVPADDWLDAIDKTKQQTLDPESVLNWRNAQEIGLK